MKQTQLEHDAHQASAVKYPICYLAHDIDVPTNVGSLFRVADALGIEKIYLTGSSITPPNKNIKKTSRSTEKVVDFEYNQDPILVIEQLKKLGYKIICLEITSTSIDIKEINIDQNEKVCLILGSENVGVNQALLDASDASVHINMLGSNSSMNVAVACSIASYELTRCYSQ